MAKLYDAFGGAQRLGTEQERRRLLNFLPSGILSSLAKQLQVSQEGTFAQIVNRVASFEWGRNDLTAKFLEFCGYPHDYLPENEVAAPDSEVVTPFEEGLRTLYDYQSSVYFRALKALQPPCSRALVQMPTGSGKTRTAMELIAAMLNGNPSRVVVWLAHSEELCEQTVNAFWNVWRFLGNRSATLCRLWGNHSLPSAIKGPCLIVAGFQKVNALQRSSKKIPSADLVVVDEAHKVLAPTFDDAVNALRSLNGRVLGLTATPGRSTADSTQNADLAEYFHSNIIGIESQGVGVIEYLQGRGVLSRLIREPLHTNVSLTLTMEEWRQLGERLDYPPEFLRRVSENTDRNRAIVERLIELAKEYQQIVVFAASVEHSKLLCAAMLYHGISAAHLDGATPAVLRRATIAKFRRGETKFLCNYGILSTGFDAPKTDAVVIARPTKSIVLYSQMIGRGLRGPAVGGTAHCRLIDVVDNIVDYSSDLDDIYEFFGEYWA
jgi:superfamily II DNA or RNA helicase